jgi:LDH2 family malate/lactate/ureidoglycolate dehydrogenase
MEIDVSSTNRVQKADRRVDPGFPQDQTCCRDERPALPGDPEREAEAIRSREGIPVLKPVVNDLLDISRRTGIPFNEL